MCLIIDRSKHATYFFGSIYRSAPKIAGYDILVSKMLRLNDEGYLYSPYKNSRYYLNQLHALGVGNMRPDFNNSIEYGIHAYYDTKIVGRDVGTTIDRILAVDKARKLYPAVIPKGTRFYIGKNGDIATEALIVYPIGQKFKRCRKDFSAHRDVSRVNL